MDRTLSELKSSLVNNSLFKPTTLKRAIDRLGFVQADPIRCPARAQDLILRHRVKNYKAGDLEQRYHNLGLDEDFTFAYGFLPTPSKQLLHPRREFEPTAVEQTVIDCVEELGVAHPAEVDKQCGDGNVKNAWGGQSKMTKRVLEKAHHLGLLRVAKRQNGIRLYEKCEPIQQTHSARGRFKALLMLTAKLFGPTSEKFLMKEAAYYRYLIETPQKRRQVLKELVEEGELSTHRIDGVKYVWPKSFKKQGLHTDSVKFLAPFDPIVRDRERFEHLWGWSYRFEAYTPASKRVRGYYALPILWKEDMIGWANAKVEDGHLHVETGFESEPVGKRAFRRELQIEVAELAEFLHLEENAWSID